MTLTDRELRAIAVKTAVACPCCGALLHPGLEPTAENELLIRPLFDVLQRGELKLRTIEDAEEAVRKKRRPRDT